MTLVEKVENVRERWRLEEKLRQLQRVWIDGCGRRWHPREKERRLEVAAIPASPQPGNKGATQDQSRRGPANVPAGETTVHKPIDNTAHHDPSE